MREYRVGELVTVKDQMLYTLPMTPQAVLQLAAAWAGVPSLVRRRAKRQLIGHSYGRGFTLWVPESIAKECGLPVQPDSRRHPYAMHIALPQAGVVVRTVPLYDGMPERDEWGAGVRESFPVAQGYHVAYRLDLPPLTATPEMMEYRR